MLGKFKTAVVLLVIGAISGFLIWGTNELTSEDILANRELREQGYYKEIFGLDEAVQISYQVVEISDGFKEIEIKNDAQETLGYIYKSELQNTYGEITVLVGIDAVGVIQNVIISSTTNTPNNVKTIKDNYLTPFVGQTITSISYDSKTGSTFTYNSVKSSVAASADYFMNNRGDE